MPFDYKKEYREFYLPPKKPHLITIPRMNFVAVHGKGDPNAPGGAYQEAMGVLYSIAFTIKMSYKGSHKMDGYFEYVVPPLEGLWHQKGVDGVDYAHKETFEWTSMIRLPEFVTPEAFDWAVQEATAKKKKDFSKAEFLTYDEGLCIQCARELNIGSINQMIDKLGISDEELEQASEQMSQFMENMGDFNFGDMSGMFNAENMDGAQTMPFANLFGDAGELAVDENESGQKQGKKRGKKGNKRQKDDGKKYLNTYCTNLTGKARDGKLDAIIGREQEISRTVQILCRRTKNNPCLIGEPGVGKTAIAEGLAIRIAKGQVPARLADKEIYLLDLTALVAGTQFRGQFEGRIKGLVDEVKAQGNIILFIDEVHNLVGTGDSEGTMNAANILKPALSRGEIQVIGATTFTEYRKFIEKDAALERRFQPVIVEEPSIEESVKIIEGIAPYYEAYHQVSISPEMCRLAVTMSERYITDRYLPDKAIDLIDEAGARLRIKRLTAPPELKELDEKIAKIAADKDEAIKGQDFEKAAELRDKQEKLDRAADALRKKFGGAAVTRATLLSPDTRKPEALSAAKEREKDKK